MQQQVLWLAPVQLSFALKLVVPKVVLGGYYYLAVVVVGVVRDSDGVVGDQGVVNCAAVTLYTLRHVLAAEAVYVRVFYFVLVVSAKDHRSVVLRILVGKAAVSNAAFVHFEALVVLLAKAIGVAL